MKKLLFIAITLVAVLLVLGNMSKPKVVGYGYDTCSTLWELTKHCPDTVDKRDFIDAVMYLNDMPNSTVYSGRVYQYPVYAKGKYERKN